MQQSSHEQDAELRNYLSSHGIEHVKLGVADGDGILRGKYLSRDKFLSALTKNLGFCDVVLGWDSNDQLFDNTTFTGWHTAYPDATVRVLPATGREIPFEPKTALFLGEFTGRAESVCPRGTLRRVLERAAGMGYEVNAAAEFEFFLFEETPQSVREKGYRQLKTMTPGAFGYSVLRSSVHSDLYHELLDLGQTMRFPIEGLHTETGPGVLEAALTYCDALEAADRAALETVKKVGMVPVEVAIPDWPYDSLEVILFAEAAAAFEDLTLSHRVDQLKVQVPDAWPNLFRQSQFLSAVDFVQSDRLRRKVANEMARVFSQVDLLLVPSLRDEMLTITNFTGHPSITLRAGFVQVSEARSDWAPAPNNPLPKFSPPRRVPHGVTLIGRLFDEGTLGCAGLALERSFGVASEQPPGF